MVSIYALNINEIPCLNELIFNKLPAYRQLKIQRMRFEKDKKLSYGAGILTKYLFLENEINESSITINTSGKPETSDFYFNLSHSGDYVVCAIGSAGLGCDIEKIAMFNPKIAERFFSDYECKWLYENSNNDIELQNNFFRLWTIKESYIKMTGEGISAGLDKFSVHFEKSLKDNRIMIIRNGNFESCYINEYVVDGYCCAVCSEEKLFNKKIINLKYYEIYDKIVNN